MVAAVVGAPGAEAAICIAEDAVHGDGNKVGFRHVDPRIEVLKTRESGV